MKDQTLSTILRATAEQMGPDSEAPTMRKVTAETAIRTLRAFAESRRASADVIRAPKRCVAAVWYAKDAAMRAACAEEGVL